MFSVHHEVNDDGVRFILEGDLTVNCAAELKAELISADQSADWHLDLSLIETLDLAGMQLLCAVCRSCVEPRRIEFTPARCNAVASAIMVAGFHIPCKVENANRQCLWNGGVQA